MQTVSECIVEHAVTLSVGSCDELTVSVPWPANSASLRRPSSTTPACQPSAAGSVSVHAVNDAGLPGPVASRPLPAISHSPVHTCKTFLRLLTLPT